MTRSKLRSMRAGTRPDIGLPPGRRMNSLFATGLLPLASAIIACLNPAQAQEAASGGTLEEVVVTAQKRSESLQDVPLSITALGTEKLEELHVENVDDYIKYLPSVSYQTTGPGSAKLYMRGVSSGGDGVHSGSPPSVGVYLDEQQPSYALFDATLGAQKSDIAIELFLDNAFDRRAENYRYTECNALLCGAQAVYAGIYRPRTVGVKFAQKF
jgi:outer membrane receptor protein involved in Fe transport